jgi:hypothetical protein
MKLGRRWLSHQLEVSTEYVGAASCLAGKPVMGLLFMESLGMLVKSREIS